MDVNVQAFLRNFNLKELKFLSYEPVNFLYKPDFCHISAKDATLKGGGRRIHGWALWEFENGIVGNFHSVWERPDGTLVDVTPPKVGTKVLFVPDESLSISDDGHYHTLYHNRTSDPKCPYIDIDGNPTNHTQWRLANSNVSLNEYCKSLEWKSASMA